MKPLYWAVLLLLLSLVFWFLSKKKRRQSGLPEGQVIYSDSSYWQKLPRPLYDPKLELVGKPDYVVRQDDGSLIPLELKSGSAPGQPWDSHKIQLAAYCYLIEQTEGKRPPYGLIKYQDKTFKIDYSTALEQDLKALILELRQAEANHYAPRSHNFPARCRNCGFRNICDQGLL